MLTLLLQPYLLNMRPLRFQNFNTKIINRKLLTRLRNPTQRRKNPTSNRVVIRLFRQIRPELIIQIINMNARINHRFTRIGRSNGGLVLLILLVLIAYLTNNLFHYIFNGNQPRRAAVLIQNNRKLNFIELEINQ